MRDDPRIRRLFRLPASESTVARDIDDEITFHIDARTADLIAQGHTPWMMRRLAEREFGDVSLARSDLATIDR